MGMNQKLLPINTLIADGESQKFENFLAIQVFAGENTSYSVTDANGTVIPSTITNSAGFFMAAPTGVPIREITITAVGGQVGVIVIPSNFYSD